MEQQASALVLSHHPALRWVLAPAGASGCEGELCQPHPYGPFWLRLHKHRHRTLPTPGLWER